MQGGAGDDTFVGAGLATAQLTQAIDARDPIAHWSLGGLDTRADGGIDDATGAHDGTARLGASLSETATVGGDGSVTFDGIDDYIEVPHSADLMLSSGTIQLWFNADDTSGKQGLLNKDSKDDDNGGHLNAYLEGSKIKVELSSDGHTYRVEYDGVTADTWHNVAFSFGEGGMQLFLDGVLVDSDPYTGGLGATSGGTGNEEPIVFGANAKDSGDLVTDNLKEYFAGSMDEVAIFGALFDAADLAGTRPTPGMRVHFQPVSRPDLRLEGTIRAVTPAGSKELEPIFQEHLDMAALAMDPTTGLVGESQFVVEVDLDPELADDGWERGYLAPGLSGQLRLDAEPTPLGLIALRKVLVFLARLG